MLIRQPPATISLVNSLKYDDLFNLRKCSKKIHRLEILQKAQKDKLPEKRQDVKDDYFNYIPKKYSIEEFLKFAKNKKTQRHLLRNLAKNISSRTKDYINERAKVKSILRIIHSSLHDQLLKHGVKYGDLLEYWGFTEIFSKDKFIIIDDRTNFNRFTITDLSHFYPGICQYYPNSTENEIRFKIKVKNPNYVREIETKYIGKYDKSFIEVNLGYGVKADLKFVCDIRMGINFYRTYTSEMDTMHLDPNYFYIEYMNGLLVVKN